MIYGIFLVIPKQKQKKIDLLDYKSGKLIKKSNKLN